jgi:hypothetical protein
MDKACAETMADTSWKVFENTTSGHMIMINEPEWRPPSCYRQADGPSLPQRHRPGGGLFQIQAHTHFQEERDAARHLERGLRSLEQSAILAGHPVSLSP